MPKKMYNNGASSFNATSIDGCVIDVILIWRLQPFAIRNKGECRAITNDLDIHRLLAIAMSVH
jgi:hypothetical protein